MAISYISTIDSVSLTKPWLIHQDYMVEMVMKKAAGYKKKKKNIYECNCRLHIE